MISMTDKQMILIPGDNATLNKGTCYEYYEAIACDGEQYDTPDGVKVFPGKKRYIVEWDILDEFDPWHDEDESNACDWDHPSAIRDCDTGEYLEVNDYDFCQWHGKLTEN